ncbi:MAG: multidrug effflux MFS transporter [Gammaproteobacteria bacterium]
MTDLQQPRIQSPLRNDIGILALLALIAAFPSIGVDLLLPGLPGLASDLRVPSESAKQAVQVFFLGFAAAHLFLGPLSDRCGRRPILLTGIAAYTIASLGCAFTGDLPVLLALRAAQGVFGAAGIILARAIISDIYGPAGTTKAMAGMFMFFVPIPIVLPILGGALVAYSGWEAVFVTMAAIGALAGIIVWRRLPETLPAVDVTNTTARNWIGVVKRIFGNRQFLRNSLSVTFCFGALVLMMSELPYILNDYFQFGPRQIGYSFALIDTALAAGVYSVRALVPRYGIDRTVYIGLFAMVAGWLCILGLLMLGVIELRFLIAEAMVGCFGMGILMSLAAGEAMVPFSANAGTASSFYGTLLYGGATGLAWLLGRLVGGSILVISMEISMLAIAALAIYWLLRPR